MSGWIQAAMQQNTISYQSTKLKSSCMHNFHIEYLFFIFLQIKCTEIWKYLVYCFSENFTFAEFTEITFPTMLRLRIFWEISIFAISYVELVTFEVMNFVGNFLATPSCYCSHYFVINDAHCTGRPEWTTNFIYGTIGFL